MWYIRNGLIQPLILEQRITVKDIRIQASIKYRERIFEVYIKYPIIYFRVHKLETSRIRAECMDGEIREISSEIFVRVI